MSDVVVQVAETTTTVSVTESSVNVNVVESPVQVSVGTSGPQGAGVPDGGSAGQFLAKASATDYDTSWVDHINTVIQEYVKNDGTSLSKGQAVYVSGANGTNIIVSAADNSTEATSSKTIGLLLQNLAINEFGYVVTQGRISGLDTSAATAGDAVWLGTSGNLIFGLANKPVAPANLVYLGVVTRAHANQGEIFVSVQNGFELNELHSVLITSPSNNQVLSYDSATSLWKNTAGTVAYATSAGSAGSATTAGSATNANYATTSGTAVFATSSGSASTATNASYATTSGTAVSISGSITPSQVTGTAVITTDSRLSDSRTPTAHAASHGSAGSDALTLAQSQVTNLTSDLAARVLLTASQTITGTQTLKPSVNSASPLTLQGLASQSAALLDFRDSANTQLAYVGNNGTIRSGTFGALATGQALLTSAADTGGWRIDTNAAANKGLIVKGAASQSANLLELQDSSANILARVASNGRIDAAQIGSTSASRALMTPGGAGGGFLVSTAVATNNAFVFRGWTSQTAALVEYQDVNNAALGGRNANAQIYTGATGPLTQSTGGATTAASGTGTTATITTTNAHGLAVGDRVTVTGVTPTGYNATAIVTAVTTNTFSYANTTTGAQTVAGSVFVDSQLGVNIRSAGTTGVIIRGASSASANLTEWQNNSGTVLSAVLSGGAMRAPFFQVTSSGLVTLTSENSGGSVRIAKQTAAGANPGAGYGNLYFRDGTLPSTLKLVVRAGAAGAETTILDNIPT